MIKHRWLKNQKHVISIIKISQIFQKSCSNCRIVPTLYIKESSNHLEKKRKKNQCLSQQKIWFNKIEFHQNFEHEKLKITITNITDCYLSFMLPSPRLSLLLIHFTVTPIKQKKNDVKIHLHKNVLASVLRYAMLCFVYCVYDIECFRYHIK